MTGQTMRKKAATNAKRAGAGMFEGIHCQCCGKELPPRTSKRGRPRIYCSKDCQKMDNLLSWAESTIDKIDFTDDAADAMKSRLFGIANSWFWEQKRQKKAKAAKAG